MKTFEEFTYKRPDINKVEKEFVDNISNLKGAENAEEFLKTVEYTERLITEIDSMITLASIRFNQDTQDEFYSGEHEFCNKLLPILQNLKREYYQVIINSKFRGNFDKKYGKNVGRAMERSLNTVKPAVLDLLEKENNLASKYRKLISSGDFTFKGKKLTRSELRSLFTSKDRETRKLANEEFCHFFEKYEEELDEIFDNLVKTRHEIALALGYDNFVELGYDRLGRPDYGSSEVKELQKHALKNFIPFIEKVKSWQKSNMGLDKLYYYDDPVYFKEDIEIKGDHSFVIKEVENTFREMGKESKEFFTYMIERNLLDLLPRKSKLDWGFCEFIKSEKAPFVFMNYSGSPLNVLTLFHEGGHALCAYMNRDKSFRDETTVGYELSEIHSMSMEYFCWPYVDRITSNPEQFKLFSLLKGALFIPYGLLVDAFQHWVYENPNVSPSDRKKQWREMEKKYLPYLDYEDNEFLDKGTFWYRQLHIFDAPFYYIDYVIAGLCAFQYLFRFMENRDKAWKDYINLINSSITYGFNDALKKGNLKSPFKEATIKEITENLESLLGILLQ